MAEIGTARSGMSARGATTRAADEHGSRALGDLVVLATFGWLGYIGLLMLLRGGRVTPDLLLVVAGLAAIAFLASRSLLLELLPFGVIALTWEAMRGLRDDLIARAQAVPIVDLERSLFGGTAPTETLQRALHPPTGLSLLDGLTTAFYLGHFVAPVLIGLLLWWRSLTVFYRYAMAMVVVAVLGYGLQVIFPVAPPRLAGLFGAPMSVQDIVRQTLDAARGLPMAAWGYGNLSANEVAAMPSLHGAFPLIGALYVAETSRRDGLLVLAYCGFVWFSIVYLGQHYVVDAVAGIGLAVLVYVAVQHPAFERLIDRLGHVRLRMRPMAAGEG